MVSVMLDWQQKNRATEELSEKIQKNGPSVSSICSLNKDTTIRVSWNSTNIWISPKSKESAKK